MTEDDYLNISNLAKLRMAEKILRDLLAMDKGDELHFAEIIGSVNFQVMKYEAKIK